MGSPGQSAADAATIYKMTLFDGQPKCARVDAEEEVNDLTPVCYNFNSCLFILQAVQGKETKGGQGYGTCRPG